MTDPNVPAWIKYLFLAVERVGGPLVLAALILYYLKTRINGSLTLFIAAIQDSTRAHQEAVATLREISLAIREHDEWAKRSATTLTAQWELTQRLQDRPSGRRR